eukprot:11679881-Alexandrium_andersonii.AAC.1
MTTIPTSLCSSLPSGRCRCRPPARRCSRSAHPRARPHPETLHWHSCRALPACPSPCAGAAPGQAPAGASRTCP